MTDDDMIEAMQLFNTIVPRVIEFRAYYNDDGSISTYTTEDIPGQFIVITSDQYAQARPDARVIDGQLVFTHRRSHVSKLTKNKTVGIATSKYDISVISSDSDSTYYTIKAYEIKR